MEDSVFVFVYCENREPQYSASAKSVAEAIEKLAVFISMELKLNSRNSKSVGGPWGVCYSFRPQKNVFKCYRIRHALS